MLNNEFNQVQLRSNNFDGIRMIAALMVLVSHQYSLVSLIPPLLFSMTGGFAAVLMFFSISGFLVLQSWQSDQNLLRFSIRRVLRIWPALIVAVLITVILLGPVASQLSVSQYFSDPQTWAYFKILVMEIQYTLPSVFESNATNSINGSLWTIPFEVACYVALAVFGVIGVLHWKMSVVVITGFIYLSALPGLLRGDWPSNWQIFSITFFFGCSLCAYRVYWINCPWRWLILFIILFIFCGLSGILAIHFFKVVTLGAIAVIVGNQSWPILRSLGKYGDISYGMYIYAFPIQQSVLALNQNKWPFATNLVISIVATILIGMLSWHLIEKPALKFKPNKPK